MDREAVAERDALERARRLHEERIVVDSLAPIFTCDPETPEALVG